MAIFCIAIGIGLLGASGSQAGRAINLQANSHSLSKYAKLEVTFDLNRAYSNPYDPDEVRVDALIAKGTETIEFPCFYFIPVQFTKDGDRSSAEEFSEDSTWMLRYSFLKEGSYSIRIRVRDNAGETLSDPVQVSVDGSFGKGFIRIHPQDQQSFRFDDGSPYYPNGFNVGWNAGSLTDLYADYMGKMGEVGANWLRYWFIGFARQALEWDTDLSRPWNEGYGLGRYNQKASAIVDTVVSLAEEKGIYLQLVLEAHGEWSTRVNSNWDRNPYSTDLGGPISSPADFFTHQQAMKLTRKRYRYTVARWGYSPAVLAWEFFNEVNFTDAYYPPSEENIRSIVQWHEEMASYIKSLDYTGRLVTTSTTAAKLLIALDQGASSLDQVQFHHYARKVHESVTQLAIDLRDAMQKPIMIGEFGLQGLKDKENHPDVWGDHIRKTIWLGAFYKVPHMYWSWTFIEIKNLYEVFRPLGEFLKDEDLAGMKTFRLDLQDELGIDMLSLAGTMNWGTTEKHEFVVDASGKTEGLPGLSRYLQGKSHAEMGSWVSFQVNFKEPGAAAIEVGKISDAGSNDIQILIDGSPAGTRVFSEPGSFAVDVSSGLHTITFRNNGADWVLVSHYGFTGVKAPALSGLGLMDSNKVYGYVYNTRDGEWIDPAIADSITDGRILLPGMEQGRYQVFFTNPRTGKVTDGGIVEARSGSLAVSLPMFKKDIAFKLISNFQ